MGFDRYLPARGEARVLAELKGSYGSKRMSRFRSRRRIGSWARTFWKTETTDEQPWVSFVNGSTSTLVAAIQPTPTSSAPEDADYTAKLLRFNGNILLRMSVNPASVTTALGGRYEAILHYTWVVMKVSANYTLDVPTDNDYYPAGSYPQAFRRRDIIKWGIVPIRPDINYDAYQVAITSGTGGAPVLSARQPNLNLPFTRIPFPRLPRGGLKLDSASNALCCYCTVTDHTMLTTWTASGNDGTPQYYPYYRTLWAKA